MEDKTLSEKIWGLRGKSFVEDIRLARLCGEAEYLQSEVQRLTEKLKADTWIPVEERLPEESGEYFVYGYSPIYKENRGWCVWFDVGTQLFNNGVGNDHLTHWSEITPPE